MPYEAISEEKYKSLTAKLKKLDFSRQQKPPGANGGRGMQVEKIPDKFCETDACTTVVSWTFFTIRCCCIPRVVVRIVAMYPCLHPRFSPRRWTDQAQAMLTVDDRHLVYEVHPSSHGRCLCFWTTLVRVLGQLLLDLARKSLEQWSLFISPALWKSLGVCAKHEPPPPVFSLRFWSCEGE